VKHLGKCDDCREETEVQTVRVRLAGSDDWDELNLCDGCYGDDAA
jgi:hypothetical protein